MPSTAAAIGVSALASYLASRSQAGAATDASEAQVAASQEALDAAQKNFDRTFAWTQQQYYQNRNDQKPWLSYGRGAVKMLGDLMGVQPDESQTLGDMTGGDGSSIATYGAGPSNRPGGARGVYTPPPGRPNTDQPVPGGGEVTILPRKPGDTEGAGGGGGQRNQPRGGTRIGAAGAPQSGPSDGTDVVRIRWPDGSVNEVNRSSLQEYQSLGAEVA